MESPSSIRLSELQAQIKSAIEGHLSKYFWITAEINDITAKPSGHCYLELVDYDHAEKQLIAKAQAWIPASTFRMLRPYFESTAGVALAPGLSVLIRVSVQYHPLYGISLQISDIDPVYTIGNIALERKKSLERLRQEGVLEMNAQLDLPIPIQRVAVISAPQAAGFRDFTQQINHNPAGYTFYIELFPSLMQGVEAPSGIISALDAIAQQIHQFDVVAIMRGGGSVSDLHCFDDYNLAYHIAQFPLPVFTGIGHDHDEHLIDLVAHTSVKTPTALAQFLLDQMERLDQQVTASGQRMQQLILGRLSAHNEALTPLVQRLKMLITMEIRRRSHAVDLLEQAIRNLNPLAPLQRGYALVLHQEKALHDAHSVALGERLDVLLAHGCLDVEVKGKK
ncbi:MAG: exodeoxyribonuclease VII large subunit [Bacteroidales bacterium]|nr:exodeoxyribonuclease VII large subunit [Bacteroidales bacterium]